jgi:hypothetical protein
VQQLCCANYYGYIKFAYGISLSDRVSFDDSKLFFGETWEMESYSANLGIALYIFSL